MLVLAQRAYSIMFNYLMLMYGYTHLKKNIANFVNTTFLSANKSVIRQMIIPYTYDKQFYWVTRYHGNGMIQLVFI